MAKHRARAQNEGGAEADIKALHHDHPEMVALTIKQICRAGNYSRAHLHKQIASGKLPSFLVGRCRRVLLWDYLEYLAQLKEEQSQKIGRIDPGPTLDKLPESARKHSPREGQ